MDFSTLNLDYQLTTGNYRSKTTRHYTDEAGRAVEIMRTFRAKRHGLIVTVRETFGGDYRTPWHSRYFDLVKSDAGWVVKETAWKRHMGITVDEGHDEHITVEAQPVRTKAEAEVVAITAAMKNEPLS